MTKLSEWETDGQDWQLGLAPCADLGISLHTSKAVQLVSKKTISCHA